MSNAHRTETALSIALPRELERHRDKLDCTERGCWMWAGTKDASGYGSVLYQGKMHRAHRLFYAHMVGPIEEGLHVDHLCNNKSCVNPKHLEAVTPKENCIRSVIRRGARRIPSPVSPAARNRQRREAILANPLSISASPHLSITRTVERWLKDGKAQGHSERTITDRQRTMARFIWWLENVAEMAETLSSLTPDTIRGFLGYLQEAREEPRWGTTHPNASVEVRPATVNAYYRTLRAFTNWCLGEELISWAALKNVKEPKVPKDQLPPFTEEQIRMMRAYTMQTQSPDRDLAIFLILLSTGLRVSELCGLRMKDIDRDHNSLRVLGKGNKRRAVFLGHTARRALWRYLEHRGPGNKEDPLFLGERGRSAAEGLQQRGVYRMISLAAKHAGVTESQCGPHALRRTFAINFLKNGGNIIELQSVMGHEDLTVLRQYVRYAEGDVEDAQRRADPADRWFRQ